MNTDKLLYRGSVKDIYQGDGNTLHFVFSDRYSIYDWGEMPDLINKKGECLGLLCSYFFKFLQDSNQWSGWTSPIELNDEEKSILRRVQNAGIYSHFVAHHKGSVQVQKINVPSILTEEGIYDYSCYLKDRHNMLVPLEVIFRFGVPLGSSYVKRNPLVFVGDRFERPVIEFSTKLESKDRYLSRKEASSIASLSSVDMERLEAMTTLISLRLKDLFAQHNIELWDGKFEFAYHRDHGFVLVDSIGPDELRLTYDEMPLSKEFLRQCYVSTDWKAELDQFQKEYPKQWKDKMIEQGIKPKKLKKEHREAFVAMYKSLVNKLYQEDVFKCRDLDQVAVDISSFMKDMK